jgi:response regulator RpfG family c-di-GMP phosphodiesterase
MPTVLCLDDLTCRLAEAAHVLRANAYEVLAADEDTLALELAAEKPLDAIILNCHRDRDNAPLVTALRILQPRAVIVLFSGYCGVPCHQLHLANACIQKEETASALLPLLRAVLCQSRYGFCRSVAA